MIENGNIIAECGRCKFVYLHDRGKVRLVRNDGEILKEEEFTPFDMNRFLKMANDYRKIFENDTH